MFGRFFVLTFIFIKVAYPQCEVNLPEKFLINKVQKKSLLNFKTIDHKNCDQHQLTYFHNAIKNFEGNIPLIKLNELFSNKKTKIISNSNTVSIFSFSGIIDQLLKKKEEFQET